MHSFRSVDLAIQIVDLHKSFAGQAVLRGVDLQVARGSTLALLGRSGSGKTVLLKCLLGLLRPDRGAVWIDGEDLSALSAEGLDRVRRKLGILFQGGALFDSLTVLENVAFPLREQLRLPAAEAHRRARGALARVGLEGAEALLPGALSGGMRQRVAFARAIVLEPEIFLFDDPTAGLDPLNTRAVIEILQRGRARPGQTTTLLVTSDVATAFRVADRVALLHQGRIALEAAPREFQRSKLPPVVAFLHRWLERSRGPASPAPRPHAA